MRHLIRCSAFCLLALGVHALGLRAEAASKWTQLRSENFLFVGDASEGEIRRVAERLEQFRDVLLRVLPGASGESDVPTVVMVFNSDRSMSPVKPLFNGKPIELAGFFLGDADINYIAVNAEDLEDALSSIFHEYTHFLVKENQGPVPIWLSEGLAELYAITQPQDGGKSVIIGRAPAHHVVTLRTNTMLPIKALLAVDSSSSIYNEGNRRSVLYAQSWALVHYLMLGNDARAAEFRNYLSAMQSGKPHEEAFAAAFDDAALLDSELSQYLQRFSFPAIVLRFADKSAATTVPRGTTLNEDEADCYLADIQARIERVDEARARLGAIQKRDPKIGRAFMVLGAIDLRAKRNNDAIAHLEKAAALAPDDFMVQSTYARSLVARMSEMGNDTAGATKILLQARPALERATTINPRSAQAQWMRAYVEIAGSGDVPAAIEAVTRAIQLDPRREEYRILLAQALVLQGEYDKATALLGPLMGAGRTPEVRTEARRVLSNLADIRAKQGAVTATAAAAPAGTPSRESAVESSAASPVSPASPAEDRRDAQRANGPPLRVVQAGEQRVFGTLDAIECVSGAIVLRVTSNGRTLAVTSTRFADVRFISYRSGAPPLKCGPLQSRDRVYLTFRPGAAGTGIDGVAVAVELLPEDFVPPPPD